MLGSIVSRLFVLQGTCANISITDLTSVNYEISGVGMAIKLARSRHMKETINGIQ